MRKAGRQLLSLLHFEGTLNWFVVEEKSYCVLPNYQLWSKDPNRRKMNCVFLKNDPLFRTFNQRLAFGIGQRNSRLTGPLTPASKQYSHERRNHNIFLKDNIVVSKDANNAELVIDLLPHIFAKEEGRTIRFWQ